MSLPLPLLGLLCLLLTLSLVWGSRKWILLPLLRRFVERRLGGYRQLLQPLDSDAPRMLKTERRVAVVGSGLAGIGAAANLAERGFDVTLIERNDYLGGKIGAWRQPVDRAPQGEAQALGEDVAAERPEVNVEHGFHAFFRHYYNLNAFLEKTGIASTLRGIDDYVILEKSGKRWGFDGVETTPVINLMALAKHGLYSIRELFGTPAIHKMDAFLDYDPEHTFKALDTTSFRQFADDAQLPASLRMVFTTFSRAFFAADDRLSMAELIKSFHFYYLSHDHGLTYDFPTADYQESLLQPLRAHLESLGVRIRLSTAVQSIARPPRTEDAATRKTFVLNGEVFDHVVMAAPGMATRAIVEASADLFPEAAPLQKQLGSVRQSQRYAVLRLWLDRPLADDFPEFVSTERIALLDALAAYHRITDEARRWANDNDGSVIELHCYAVPDDVSDNAAIRAALLTEMEQHFPELRGAQVMREVLQVRDDFAAFHTGCWERRPTTTTSVDGLYLAGDWVRLPIPAMLMEAAYSAGLLAANAILTAEGLRCEPVFTVPRRGILAPLADFRRAAAGKPDPRRIAAAERTH